MQFLQKSTFKLFFVACLALTGLGLAHAGGGIGGTGRVFGEITAFGSIFVNGVEYNISTANIIINGAPATQADLKLGMAVRVDGTVNPAGLTGTATTVEFLGDIEGAIDGAPVISGTNGVFQIYGLVIKTDGSTKYTDGVTLATLNAGDAVEVNGLYNANDQSYTATRIEKRSSFQQVDVRGVISNVDTTAKTFRLGASLVVSYASAQVRDVPNNVPANGLFVEVKAAARPANNVLMATVVAGEGSVLVIADMPFGMVQGIAANVTAGAFSMGNQPIVINAQTVFDAAPPSALLNGQKAVATGPVTNGVMTATVVTIGPALVSVQSRKIHGSAGTFNLPVDTSANISGAVTVEPRAKGGNHTIVFHFDSPVTSVGGATANDVALADAGPTTFVLSGGDVVISLSRELDTKRVKIRLTDINLPGNSATAAMGFLVGDINNTRDVDGADLGAMRARSGQLTNATNFMFDLNASGSINGADIQAVKARRGHALN